MVLRRRARAARARRRPTDGAERGLVVATYNIHTCVGVDRRYDPPRIAAVLRELDAFADGRALRTVAGGGRLVED